MAGRANAISFAIKKTKRVVRSVFGAELIALADAADLGFSFRDVLTVLLHHPVELYSSEF